MQGPTCPWTSGHPLPSRKCARVSPRRPELPWAWGTAGTEASARGLPLQVDAQGHAHTISLRNPVSVRLGGTSQSSPVPGREKCGRARGTRPRQCRGRKTRGSEVTHRSLRTAPVSVWEERRRPPPPLFGACVLNTVGSARLWLPWKPAGRLLGPLVKYFQCTCLQVSTTHPFPNAY